MKQENMTLAWDDATIIFHLFGRVSMINFDKKF